MVNYSNKIPNEGKSAGGSNNNSLSLALEKLETTSHASQDEYEVHQGSVEKTLEVLSVLSNPEAFSLFVLAKDGIESDLSTFSKLGMTKKQYYTRLKQLVDSGIVTKMQNAYYHSAFGKVTYEEIVGNLLQDVSRSKELEMVDVLQKSTKFSSDDIEAFVSKMGLSKKTADRMLSKVTKKQESTIEGSSAVKLAWTFEDMVSTVIDAVEDAKNEVLLVTRFANDKIINSITRKAQMEGVYVKVIADNSMVKRYFESMDQSKVIADDRNKEERFEVVSNPFYPENNVQRRYANVPFCILVIDQKYTGIEVVDSTNSDKYKLAMFVQNDEQLAKQITSLFNGIWNNSSKDVPQSVTKTAKQTR